MGSVHPQPTLQQLLGQRQAEVFVGRDAQLVSFTDTLALRLDDPRRRFIYNVHGQGGFGKTTLLRQLQRAADAADAATGWCDHGQSDLVAAMRTLAKSLGGDFAPFEKLVATYERGRHTVESDPTAPAALAGAIGGAIGRGGVVLGRRIPLMGAALDLVDPDSASAQVAEVASFLARRLSRDDAELVGDPIPALTTSFLVGLTKLASRSST